MNYLFVIIIIITLLADNASLSIIALNYHDLEFNLFFLENNYLTQYFHYNLLAITMNLLFTHKRTLFFAILEKEDIARSAN